MHNGCRQIEWPDQEFGFLFAVGIAGDNRHSWGGGVERSFTRAKYIPNESRQMGWPLCASRLQGWGAVIIACPANLIAIRNTRNNRPTWREVGEESARPLRGI